MSKVDWMGAMFAKSPFNGDISDWDVSNVEYMSGMFDGARNFNEDLSRWNMLNPHIAPAHSKMAALRLYTSTTVSD